MLSHNTVFVVIAKIRTAFSERGLQTAPFVLIHIGRTDPILGFFLINKIGTVFAGASGFGRHFLRFVDRTEQFHFFFYGGLDGFYAVSQKLSRIISFADAIFTGFDILPGSSRKSKLAFRIHIDL